MSTTLLPLSMLFTLLAPADVCQSDLGFGDPGGEALAICGDILTDPTRGATLSLPGGPASTPIYLQGILPAGSSTLSSNALEVVVGVPSLPHAESFDGADGSAWPYTWAVVTEQELDGNRARLGGDAGHVARMVCQGNADGDARGGPGAGVLGRGHHG